MRARTLLAALSLSLAVPSARTLADVPHAAVARVDAVDPLRPLSPLNPLNPLSPLSPRDTVERFTLPNGLTVILHEDHRAPVVAVNVWYHVGSKDEPAGKNGFAHLFEHLMFQGSKHVGEDMFFRYLERAGATERNGTTNLDRTNYYEVLPKTQLPLALWLESDRMGTLLDHVDQATFESQREVVKNERRQNYENAPYGMVWGILRAALYPKGHPYHLLTIGTPEDLDAASLDDVRAFFRTWYVPNNATLVLVGDLDVPRTKALVTQYFGPIARGPDSKPKTESMPVTRTAETRLSIEADVELPRLMLAWPSPRCFGTADAELDVVAHMLGGGKSSRLYKRLVYELQIAQDVSVGQGSSLLASEFTVSVTLRTGHTPEEARAIVDDELEALRRKPPSADEVERAKAAISSGIIFSREGLSAMADEYNRYAQFTGDPAYFAKDLARYERASAASVQQAAVDWLLKRGRVVATVTPTKGAPRAGRLVKSEEAK
jgi:zinc protease